MFYYHVAGVFILCSCPLSFVLLCIMKLLSTAIIVRFCYMSPFNGKCETPEQQMGHGIITVSAKRSGYTEQTATQQEVILKVKHNDTSVF